MERLRVERFCLVRRNLVLSPRNVLPPRNFEVKYGTSCLSPLRFCGRGFCCSFADDVWGETVRDAGADDDCDGRSTRRSLHYWYLFDDIQTGFPAAERMVLGGVHQ